MDLVAGLDKLPAWFQYVVILGGYVSFFVKAYYDHRESQVRVRTSTEALEGAGLTNDQLTLKMMREVLESIKVELDRAQKKIEELEHDIEVAEQATESEVKNVRGEYERRLQEKDFQLQEVTLALRASNLEVVQLRVKLNERGIVDG